MITPAGLRALAQLRDVTEALQFGEDEDALEALRPAWRALETAVAREGGDLLPMLAVSELLASPPGPIDWVWQGRIAAGDVLLCVGDPGVGKSMVALALSILVANGGGELLDEPVASAEGGALYIDLENTVDQVYERLHAFGGEASAANRLAYVHRPAGFNLGQPEWRARLAATIAARKPRIVVIDSMRRAAPGLDENDSTAVAEFMAPLRDLAAEHGPAIKIIHHPRKPQSGEKVDALHAARGSGDLVASVDGLLYFRRVGDSGLVRLEHAKPRRGHIHEPAHYRIRTSDAGGPVLELVHVEAGNDDELYEKVLQHVVDHPGDSTEDVRKAVKASRSGTLAALERGTTSNQVVRGPGRRRDGAYWYPNDHAGLKSTNDFADDFDIPRLPGSDGAEVAESSPLNRSGATNDFSDPEPLPAELEWDPETGRTE